MGMYNELNNISRAVNGQALQKENKSIKKYKNEQGLLIKLEYYISKYKKSGKDIYNVNIQDEIIQKAVISCFGELQSHLDPSNPAKFVEDYKTEDERIDEDYYQIFCVRHYLSCCRNVENYLKNRTNEKTSEQEYIRLEILEIKKQQEAEKLKKLQQQNLQHQQIQKVQQQKKETSKAMEIVEIIAKIIKYILIATVAIIGGLFWMVISAASKQK